MTASAPLPRSAGTATAPEGATLDLVDWVGFKWLMASEGERVDATRAMDDSVYARECLMRGLSARDTDLRETARQMLRRLQPGAHRP